MTSSSSLIPRNLFQIQKCIPKSWKKGLLDSQTNLSTTWNQIPLDSTQDPLMDSRKNHPITPKNTESLISSIETFTTQAHLSNAFRDFYLLHLNASSSLLLNPISLLLSSCTTLKAVPQGKQVHAHIISLGFEKNYLLVPKLVTFYTSFGDLSDAHFIAENSYVMHVLPWNILISAYVRNGFYGEALFSYEKLVKMGIKADNFTYPAVLKACGEELELELGKRIHSCLDRSGLGWSLYVHNALVSMYGKLGLVDVARKLFEEMPERDVISWNAIIFGYASKGMWNEAFKLFERMLMGHSEVNSVTWNTIASGNVQVGNYLGALKLISRMKNRATQLDFVTHVIGLGACSRTGLVKLGREIHGSAIRSRCDLIGSVRNALITMYSRCKDLRHAYMLFRTAETRNVITWNCLIAGYAHLDRSEETSFMFREMVSCGVEPNYVTIASILPLCARVANLQHGKELHCYVVKHELDRYLLLWNSLVDMYAKSGRIYEARRVFNRMKEKDEVSYTSLIAGYGMQGEGQLSLKLFDEMERCGIKPDHITMVAVLSACSHSGLVTQGQKLFEKMVSFYGLIPKMEHFSCMVDLFGRAGLLRKAEELIMKMPFKPSAAMWATLLGACRIHREMKIGEWAAEMLLEMRPENPGYYVLIANMHAAAGCWSKLAKVRTLMRDLGLKKSPGCTWIDVGNGWYPFVVGDRSSSQAQEIYVLLEGLDKNMKEAGYVANEDLGFYGDDEE